MATRNREPESTNPPTAPNAMNPPTRAPTRVSDSAPPRIPTVPVSSDEIGPNGLQGVENFTLASHGTVAYRMNRSQFRTNSPTDKVDFYIIAIEKGIENYFQPSNTLPRPNRARARPPQFLDPPNANARTTITILAAQAATRTVEAIRQSALFFSASRELTYVPAIQFEWVQYRHLDNVQISCHMRTRLVYLNKERGRDQFSVVHNVFELEDHNFAIQETYSYADLRLKSFFAILRRAARMEAL